MSGERLTPNEAWDEGFNDGVVSFGKTYLSTLLKSLAHDNTIMYLCCSKHFIVTK